MKGLVVPLIMGMDGGVDASTALSAEDQEVVDNLELLLNLESAQDLELLEDLAVQR